jgi:hypothetical protein
MRKPIKTLEEVRDRYNIIDVIYGAEPTHKDEPKLITLKDVLTLDPKDRQCGNRYVDRPQKMTGLSTPIYYHNKQWAVTSYGLECLTHSYLIELKRLDEMTNEREWSDHMAEKIWCDIDAFYDAWVFAIDHFNDINNNPTKRRDS